MDKKQIFEGIRILDFTQVIAGSYATMIMGDMGAEVVKVEPPGRGDALRFAGPMHHGESGFFLLNNRNKKSISVDLKSREGIALLRRLLPKFDVVTENFKPGAMQGLGLGYEELRAIKEDIIYLSISGYGHGTSYSDRPAYDNIIQAESGLASLNGLPEYGMPMRSPLSISDYAAGMYGAFAIASALFHRNLTGAGQYLDVAMYDALISIMDNTFLIYDFRKEDLKSGKAAWDEVGLKSTGNRHPGAAPHGYFKTKDGFVAHMSLTNDMWHLLLKIIGKQDLVGNPKYEKLDNRKELWREIDAVVEEWTTLHTTEEVLRAFTENRLPCGKVRSIGEVFEDPQSKERGIFEEVEHPVAGRLTITNLPIKFSETPAKIRRPSPRLGEHNREILTRMLGMSQEDVDDLLARGVLYSQGEQVPE